MDPIGVHQKFLTTKSQKKTKNGMPQIPIDQELLIPDKNFQHNQDQITNKKVGQFNIQQRQEQPTKKIQHARTIDGPFSQGYIKQHPTHQKYQQKPYNINTIFYQPKTQTIYVPAYLRLMVKNFKSINLQNLTACINVTIIINTFTFGLSQDIRKYISKNIILQFNYDDHIVLNQCKQIATDKFKLSSKKLQEMFRNNIPNCQSNQYYNNLFNNKDNLKIKYYQVGDKYTIRLKRNAKIDPYVFLSPFGLTDVVLSIGTKPMAFIRSNKQKVSIKINLMDHYNNNVQFITKRISFAQNNQFGIFKIATRRLVAQYSRLRTHKTLMQNKKTIYHFKVLDIKRQKFQTLTDEQARQRNIKFAHFHIPVSRNTSTALVTLFFPLWLFSILILSVFYMEPKLDDRICIISSLIIAFAALVPDLRSHISTSPAITIFQILVYAQAFSTILLVLQSLRESSIMKKYVQLYSILQPKQDPQVIMDQYILHYFKQYNVFKDRMFLMTFYISIFNFVVPVLLYLFHFLFSLQNYHEIDIKDCEDIDTSFQNWTKSPADQKLSFQNENNTQLSIKDRLKKIKSKDPFLLDDQNAHMIITKQKKYIKQIIFIHDSQFQERIPNLQLHIKNSMSLGNQRKLI